MYRQALSTDKTIEPIDGHMIAAVRLVLASSALVIIYIDPSEPDRFVSITYGALLLYTLYSASLYVLQVRYSSLSESIPSWSHWADVGWYLVLIALSSGTSSIFFFFFFFSILVASFRWGFVSGLRVVIVSSVFFTMVGYATAPAGRNFELNRFLLRPIFLLVLGYMMAYWGGYEIGLKRRLALLKEVSSLSNPRFGVNRTLGVILERLRAFYDAGACVLVMQGWDTGDFTLRRADRLNPEAGMRAEPLTAQMMRQMLAFPADYALIYNSRPHNWLRSGPRFYAFDLATGEHSTEDQETGEALADLLEAKAYVSVPLYFRKEVIGRGYVAAERPYSFSQSDIDFLLQVIGQFMPIVDNIRLVDRLASDAAEEERRKIARDIHDSLIQPYIGIQIGLDALDQKLTHTDLTAGGERLIEMLKDVAKGVRRLRAMTGTGIQDLRRYVGGLAEKGRPEGNLLPSLRRFTARFSDATGIAVSIEAESEIRVDDRLAAELFQMVAEGLSNLRRHTESTCATIRLASSEGRILLKIENEGGGAKPELFTPRSLSERASSLGGHVQIEQHGDGHTAVIIEVPL
jgi:signal transduction histidine kinase